jgi:hypothetical protein
MRKDLWVEVLSLESLLVTPPPKGGSRFLFFLKGRKGKKKGDGIHYLGYKRTLELLCKFTTIKLQQQRQHPQFSSGTAADIPRSSSFLR